MENYICVNGKKIALTKEQVQQIAESCVEKKEQVSLAEIPVGAVFKLSGDNEFVVLEQMEGSTAVILKNKFGPDSAFGENNNYNGCFVDEICNSLAEVIENIVGEDALIPHTVDLTADDGLKDYGVVSREVSLLTADQYRKYVYILDKHKLDNWWWLATPHSTATHEHETCVKCVSPSGSIINDDYYNDSNGVRPFLILKSSIFVSV